MPPSAVIATVSPEQSSLPGISDVREGLSGVSLETTVSVSDTVQPFASSAMTVIISLFLTVKLATDVEVETVAAKFAVEEDCAEVPFIKKV